MTPTFIVVQVIEVGTTRGNPRQYPDLWQTNTIKNARSKVKSEAENHFIPGPITEVYLTTSGPSGYTSKLILEGFDSFCKRLGASFPEAVSSDGNTRE